MHLMTTPQACKYLREQHGITYAPSYLTKLRCVGGGPKFRRVGGRNVFYPAPALDEWAAARVSDELTSTSQAA